MVLDDITLEKMAKAGYTKAIELAGKEMHMDVDIKGKDSWENQADSCKTHWREIVRAMIKGE